MTRVAGRSGLDQLVSEIDAAGAAVEVFDYPGTGHLFTDASRPDEYDETATELLWTRALAFCASPSSLSRSSDPASRHTAWIPAPGKRLTTPCQAAVCSA